ncbi:MAG: sensor histidine kinase [Bacillota bacterium]
MDKKLDTPENNDLVKENQELREKLSGLQKEIERSDKELQTFAYAVSHDLREPLRMVAGFVQLLSRHLDGKLDSKSREYMDYAIEGALKMQSMLDDILKFSRIYTRGNPFSQISAQSVVEKVIKRLGTAITDTSAEISCKDLPEIYADPVQIEQLFEILISNALKFHGLRRPVIKISCKSEDEKYIFSVADNGIGIEKEYYDRIFVLFHRLHPDEFPGSGTGLSLAQRIVERHHGNIWVNSIPNEGSTFCFSMPVNH